MTRKIIVIAIMVMFSTAVYAGGKGTTGAAFLKIGVGGRPAAMGETYCAISDDATASYWNPAGLASVKDIELSAMYTWWLQGISHQFLCYARPVSKQGTFGVSLIGLQVTGIEERG